MGVDEAVVVNRLLRWARWKLKSDVSLGYKSKASFMSLLPQTGLHDESIDSECIETNNVVEQLPELHKALIRIEYLSTCLDEKFKAHAFGCCIRSWRQWKHDAHQKIANHLNLRLTMVPLSDHNVQQISNCVQMMQQEEYI